MDRFASFVPLCCKVDITNCDLNLICFLKHLSMACETPGKTETKGNKIHTEDRSSQESGNIFHTRLNKG
jgi:hypothetical protein